MLVVLVQKLDLHAALGVDLLGGHLRAVLAGIAVNGSRAGEGTNDADLQGVLSHGGGDQAHDHHDGEEHCNDCLVELHNRIPPNQNCVTRILHVYAYR